jgi:gluconate 5-dehydrogenase
MSLVKNLMNLNGKTALVAGGAGYLGTSFCETLAELGANIVIASRDVDKCSQLCKKIESEFKVSAKSCYLDLFDKKSITDCIDFTVSEFQSLDILITSAWSGKKNSWDSISNEDWDYDIEVCLNGIFRLVKESTAALKSSKGIILTVSSMYGHIAPDYKLYANVPQINPPSYGAAKAGIIQLTKYLASFLAPYGIRANCISPGAFPFKEISKEYPEFSQRLCEKNPLGRIGEPDDLKGVTALLCSDLSKYITGQNICVDGGWSVW